MRNPKTDMGLCGGKPNRKRNHTASEALVKENCRNFDAVFREQLSRRLDQFGCKQAICR